MHLFNRLNFTTILSSLNNVIKIYIYISYVRTRILHVYIRTPTQLVLPLSSSSSWFRVFSVVYNVFHYFFLFSHIAWKTDCVDTESFRVRVNAYVRGWDTLGGSVKWRSRLARRRQSHLLHVHQNSAGRAKRRDANVELTVCADRLRQQACVLYVGVADSMRHIQKSW